WLADTLQIGYGTILNLEKLGLSMPPQFKMMILAGLDIKAKPDLANAHGRQEMIDYIKKNYPFYQRFEIKGQDDSGWLETIDQIFNQPE
ncbi:hypothetical protein, partial [Klebsiella pneumoniae]|uniref:hypothetical protein n=1 Tax=Klebsiella pneumoniae TaxID=573 RepID=UPI0038552A87